ncbi:MAG: peptidyl-prolyl cis-trans isomerase [bacterium]|nr:peptidyl-prolyl cis-trans isomerase [bacterium]
MTKPNSIGMLTRLLAILLFLLSYAGSSQAQDPVLIATVNGEQITSEMLELELGRIHMSHTTQVERSNFDVERLITKLVNDRLLVQDAMALGMDAERTIVDAVRWFREVRAYEAMMKEIQPEGIPVTDEEISEGFEKFYRRAMIRLICVPDSGLCAAIVDSIHQGVSMASLSRNHAIDKYKNVGGDAGVYPLYDLPEDLVKELETAPLGTLVGPRFLWQAWAAIRAEAFLPADKAILDSVQVLVKRQLMIDKATVIRKNFIAIEGGGIPVHVDTAAVDSILVRMNLGLESTDRTIAKVGASRNLTEADLRQKYIHRIVGRNDRYNSAVLYETLDEQVQVMQLKEIATLKRFVEDSRFDDDALRFRDSMLVVNYLQSVVAPTIKVSEQEIAEFYQTNQERFRKPGRVRVATITRETLEETQKDYEKILAGADFAWMAEQYSIDDFKERGGLRDWTGMELFPPAFAEQLDTTAVGSCLPPLVSDEGYSVMKIVDREPGPLQTLDEAREKIRSMVERQKQFKAIDATILDLRAHAEIVMNDEAIRAMQISGPSGE